MISKGKNKISCLGIGGGAMYYISKYYHYLGYEVEGYDIRKTSRTRELEELGIKIIYHNPEKPLYTDLIIWSDALPNWLLQKIKYENSAKKFKRVDEIYVAIIAKIEKNELTKSQKSAVTKSELAPLYDIDTSNVVMIGITGTDGKTTTSEMIASILEMNGHKVGIINTVNARIGEQKLDTGLHVTTPSAQENAKLIKEMLEAECSHIIIESTSHGLSSGRLSGLKYDFALYTNITDEHLDFHKTVKELIRAKSLLITKYLKEKGIAVVNYDDIRVRKNIYGLAEQEIIYSQKYNPKGDLYTTNIRLFPEYINCTINKRKEVFIEKLVIPMIGRYNVSNALAAIACADALSIKPHIIKKGIENLKQVPGRTEILQKSPFIVIVDFAHTPNGLYNVLSSVKQIKKSDDKNIIVVFGCAGKRDPTKRYKMGKLAGELADVTILTAEDPRTESLKDINDAIESGWLETKSESSNLIRFDDEALKAEVRRRAIMKALEIAQPGDMVIITGKAHEKSLCFGTEEYDWNDLDEVKKLLKK